MPLPTGVETPTILQNRCLKSDTNVVDPCQMQSPQHFPLAHCFPTQALPASSFCAFLGCRLTVLNDQSRFRQILNATLENLFSKPDSLLCLMFSRWCCQLAGRILLIHFHLKTTNTKLCGKLGPRTCPSSSLFWALLSCHDTSGKRTEGKMLFRICTVNGTERNTLFHRDPQRCSGLSDGLCGLSTRRWAFHSSNLPKLPELASKNVPQDTGDGLSPSKSPQETLNVRIEI